jgi:transposase
VIVDNYRIHFAKPILALLAAHSERIELVTLPTYSPQLNPVERHWKHLRRKVTHNTFFQTIDQLLDAATGFFHHLAACPDTVRLEYDTNISLLQCFPQGFHRFI